MPPHPLSQRKPRALPAAWLAAMGVVVGLVGFVGLLAQARAEVAGPAVPPAVQQGGPDAPEPAPGPAERLAILRLPVLGTTREVEGMFRGALHGALRQAGLAMAPQAEVEAQLAQDPQLASCRTLSCYARLAVALGVRRVIVGQIARPQRSSYLVQLQARDLATGQMVTPLIEERCEICSTEEARQAVVRAADRLRRALPPLRPEEQDRYGAPLTGVLDLRTDPAGVAVRIDGALQEEVPPAAYLLGIGVHSLELRAPGYRTLRRPVEIAPSQRVAMNLYLAAIPPRRPWLTALGALSTLASAGFLTTSVVLAAYDGKPVYNDPSYTTPCGPPVPHCPLKYDNVARAAAFGAAAGALAIGAAVAFAIDFGPPRRRPVVMWPGGRPR